RASPPARTRKRFKKRACARSTSHGARKALSSASNAGYPSSSRACRANRGRKLIMRMRGAGFIAIAAMTVFGIDARAEELVQTSGFVESGGEQIHFIAVGTGETLVLCHGLGGNHAIWYQQVPVFA